MVLALSRPQLPVCRPKYLDDAHTIVLFRSASIPLSDHHPSLCWNASFRVYQVHDSQFPDTNFLIWLNLEYIILFNASSIIDLNDFESSDLSNSTFSFLVGLLTHVQLQHTNHSHVVNHEFH